MSHPFGMELDAGYTASCCKDISQYVEARIGAKSSAVTEPSSGHSLGNVSANHSQDREDHGSLPIVSDIGHP